MRVYLITFVPADEFLWTWFGRQCDEICENLRWGDSVGAEFRNMWRNIKSVIFVKVQLWLKRQQTSVL